MSITRSRKKPGDEGQNLVNHLWIIEHYQQIPKLFLQKTLKHDQHASYFAYVLFFEFLSKPVLLKSASD